MANKKIVKVKEIYLYTGLTDQAADCVECIKLLKSSNIPFILLNYNDQEDQHKLNFESLSTWTFGEEGSSYKKEFYQYPILIYDVCYDDWSIVKHADHGLNEIKKSNIFKLSKYI